MRFNYLKLGELVKEAREKKEYSTRKLGEKVGISHAEISRFENGLKPNFHLIPLIKICEELDIDFVDLLTLSGYYIDKSVGLYSIKFEGKEELKFETPGRSSEEALGSVISFLIKNDVLESIYKNTDNVIVEEITNKEKINNFYEDLSEKVECSTCEWYCPICEECTYEE